MILLGKIALGLTAVTFTGAGLLCSEGFVNVNVNEHGRTDKQREHIHVIAPALLVPIAVRLVPDDKLANAADKIQPWLPTIRAAIEGLGDSPDMTIVEVSNAREYVQVAKDGGSIVVDVANPRETVHASVPLRAIDSTVSALAAAETNSSPGASAQAQLDN
jgi:hypothetical protein